MPIIPPFPFGRKKAPEFYRMSCPGCGFSKLYELEKADTVYNDPENGPSGDPEVVKELPKVCPKCGAKLKKETIPVRICH